MPWLPGNHGHAAGPVVFGLRRMVDEHPLHAALIDKWRILPSDVIGTMGVRLASDLRVELHFNPQFATEISPEELVSVLLHEVHHVLFRHINIRAEDYPDRWALTVAEEVTANEFITGKLPGHPVRLEDFPALPLRESTVARYQRLASRRLGDDGAASAPGPAAGTGVGIEVDDHGLWGTGEDVADTLLDRLVGADARGALQALPDQLRAQAAGELMGLLGSRGGSPGSETLALPSAGKSETNWRAVLRAFVRQLGTPALSLLRPSRRLPKLVGIVPGRVRSPRRPKVMVAVDTSGSMIEDSILAAIRTELVALAHVADLHVVECDCEVQREYPYAGEVFEMRGGGGTSFEQPLSPEFLAGRRIDAVLYLTDGDGTAPEQQPRVPVLWCLIGEGARPPASWGKVIRIPSSTR